MMNRGSICGSQALNRKSDRIALCLAIHSPSLYPSSPCVPEKFIYFVNWTPPHPINLWIRPCPPPPRINLWIRPCPPLPASTSGYGPAPPPPRINLWIRPCPPSPHQPLDTALPPPLPASTSGYGPAPPLPASTSGYGPAPPPPRINLWIRPCPPPLPASTSGYGPAPPLPRINLWIRPYPPSPHQPLDTALPPPLENADRYTTYRTTNILSNSVAYTYTPMKPRRKPSSSSFFKRQLIDSPLMAYDFIASTSINSFRVSSRHLTETFPWRVLGSPNNRASVNCSSYTYGKMCMAACRRAASRRAVSAGSPAPPAARSLWTYPATSNSVCGNLSALIGAIHKHNIITDMKHGKRFLDWKPSIAALK